MKINGVEFQAIVASLGSGKSYLADNYEEFVDVDELRLRCKYVVPENLTRWQLESTKGQRNFEKRENFIELLLEQLNTLVHSDKILIAAPHEEILNYFEKNNITYCFVYPGMESKQQMIDRWIVRGNPKEFVDENIDIYDSRFKENSSDKRATCHYQLQPGEFLSNLVEKAGIDFSKLTPKHKV